MGIYWLCSKCDIEHRKDQEEKDNLGKEMEKLRKIVKDRELENKEHKEKLVQGVAREHDLADRIRNLEKESREWKLEQENYNFKGFEKESEMVNRLKLNQEEAQRNIDQMNETIDHMRERQAIELKKRIDEIEALTNCIEVIKAEQKKTEKDKKRAGRETQV